MVDPKILASAGGAILGALLFTFRGRKGRKSSRREKREAGESFDQERVEGNGPRPLAEAKGGADATDTARARAREEAASLAAARAEAERKARAERERQERIRSLPPWVWDDPFEEPVFPQYEGDRLSILLKSEGTIASRLFQDDDPSPRRTTPRPQQPTALRAQAEAPRGLSLARTTPPQPVARPLTSLAELLAWEPGCRADDPFVACDVPLAPSWAGPSGPARPRVLMCHDMQGGYQSDAPAYGSPDPAFFSLQRWDLVDTLVYFSHNLVTIPPPGWTAAAHTHGASVLGTMTTEWDQGARLCEELFASERRARILADKLAAIAAYFGFDGWLINIENSVDPDTHLPHLLYFLKLLRRQLRAVVGPHATVIWYDAVTVEGKLEWQSTLSPLNRPFLDCCDGIFLNYTWKEGTPAEVLASLRQGSRGRLPHQVYMGVDVFGRGTYGGGGDNSHVAVELAMRHGLSAALFAPGWLYETAEDKTSWPQRADSWFDSLARVLPYAPRPVRSMLPVASAFHPGVTAKGVWVGGRRVRGAPSWDLRAQSLQASLTGGRAVASTVSTTGELFTVAVAPTADVAFHGSGCMQVRGALPAGTRAEFRLFRTNASIPPTGLLVSFTSLHPINEADIALTLYLEEITPRASAVVPPAANRRVLLPANRPAEPDAVITETSPGASVGAKQSLSHALEGIMSGSAGAAEPPVPAAQAPGSLSAGILQLLSGEAAAPGVSATLEDEVRGILRAESGIYEEVGTDGPTAWRESGDVARRATLVLGGGGLERSQSGQSDLERTSSADRIGPSPLVHVTPGVHPRCTFAPSATDPHTDTQVTVPLQGDTVHFTRRSRMLAAGSYSEAAKGRALAGGSEVATASWVTRSYLLTVEDVAAALGSKAYRSSDALAGYRLMGLGLSVLGGRGRAESMPLSVVHGYLGHVSVEAAPSSKSVSLQEMLPPLTTWVSVTDLVWSPSPPSAGAAPQGDALAASGPVQDAEIDGLGFPDRLSLTLTWGYQDSAAEMPDPLSRYTTAAMDELAAAAADLASGTGGGDASPAESHMDRDDDGRTTRVHVFCDIVNDDYGDSLPSSAAASVPSSSAARKAATGRAAATVPSPVPPSPGVRSYADRLRAKKAGTGSSPVVSSSALTGGSFKPAAPRPAQAQASPGGLSDRTRAVRAITKDAESPSPARKPKKHFTDTAQDGQYKGLIYLGMATNSRFRVTGLVVPPEAVRVVLILQPEDQRTGKRVPLSSSTRLEVDVL